MKPFPPNPPANLERFLAAQALIYDQVRRELAAGAKRSHWMWFIFPQIAGLGHSATSRHFAIGGLDEARAYLAHPVLGPRLHECTALVNGVAGRSVAEIFGSPDDMKFHSCMTLFARADCGDSIFDAALHRYFDGVPDAATQAKLE
jgi:uncharacterized protein (DUF1810 family)